MTAIETADVVIVGARCAGTAAAVPLARAGLRVVVLDRTRFPADTLSTHVLVPNGVQELLFMGALDRIAGLVFGQCTDCDPGAGFGSLTLAQILDDHIRPLGIPAYRGAMIGHVREQFIVPVGGRVELDADEGVFRLLGPVLA